MARQGPNTLLSRELRWWTVFGRQFRSPFVYLLGAAAALAFFLGEPIDGAFIVFFVFLNALLGFFQEYHSERALQVLQRYVVPRARVRREGSVKLIPSAEVVPGDLLIVEPGDIIAADLRFIETSSLLVDESALTGESLRVEKHHRSLSEPTAEIFAAKNVGFSGTTVVSGRGVGVVFATGRQTTIGEIARLTVETVRISSFELSVRKFSSFILRLILVTLFFVFLANLVLRGGRINLIELLIFSIALAVSVIPEALPVVTTFALSHGALRLAKNHVVVKRLSAIEDLGSIEVLCTDKTGTLTENRLSVTALLAPDQPGTLLLAAEGMSSAPSTHEPVDAFDRAIWERLSSEQRERLRSRQRVAELPFDPERRRNSVAVSSGKGSTLIVRGAPETVLALCPGLSAEARATQQRWLVEQGAFGRRVLAVAEKTLPGSVPTDLAAAERGLRLQGLIAFADPLKPTTRRAVEQAQRLGVRLKILTGDSREVAGAVALQTGLTHSANEVITGAELERLSPAEQFEAVERHAVFARVSPEQKHKIVKLLESRFEVGFLGEGINDAPALKVANVGLVVQSGADIAREAGDIVLLQRSLNVVVDGIRLGREVFANTTKYIKATLSSNFGNFYAVALASLLVDFLPLLPLQILLINLLSDFPMISVATDRVDAEDLSRPRHYDIKHIAFLATILGLVSTLFDFIFFAVFSRISPGVLRTNWFIGSILTELVFLFSIRTRFSIFRARRPSGTVLGLSLAAAAATVVLPFTRFGQTVFEFLRPTGTHLALIFVIVAVYFVSTESVKVLYYRFAHQRGKTLVP